jgi:hypothetical protein
MFTAIRAETAHSPTYQLLRGELKKRGGRSPKSRNQVIAGGGQTAGFSSQVFDATTCFSIATATNDMWLLTKL